MDYIFVLDVVTYLIITRFRMSDKYYDMSVKYLKMFGFTDNFFCIGSPSQKMTTELPINVMKDWSGIRPCFISHNNYLSYDIRKGKPWPTSIVMKYIFFDFDHPSKLENPMADAYRLDKYRHDKCIAGMTHFSAGKGFHGFIKLKPKIYRIDTYEQMNALKQMYGGIQQHLRHKLKLKTLDFHVMYDFKRLFRAPYMRHQKTKLFVSPIDTDRFNDISSILGYSRNPEWYADTSGNEYTLVELARILNVKPSSNKIESRKLDIELNMSESANNFMTQLMISKPCLLDGMTANNPTHFCRVQTCLFAKRNGITKQAFNDIYDEMANEFNYVDRQYDEVRRSQIDGLYEKDWYVHEARCSTIKRQSELCLGKAKYNDNRELIKGCIKYRELGNKI